MMTMQLPEVLAYESESYALCTLPLDCYLTHLNERPSFFATPTCLERMYVGTWRIENNKLYLTHLSAKDRDGNQISMHHLFPNAGNAAWANWYSGTLRCPLGKRLKTIPFGFQSVYEADLLLTIEGGMLVGVHRRINPPAPDRPGDDDIPAFLRRHEDVP